MFRRSERLAVPFQKNVVDWIMACRVEDGGIPYFRCYDSETTCLTEDGWKNFEEVDFDDLIATLNPETEMLEYQNPTNIINVPYKGKMYKIRTNQVSLVVTPTHNLFVALACSQRVGGRNGRKLTLPRKEWNFALTPAEKCFGKHVLYKKNCEWNGKNQDYFILPSTTIQQNSSKVYPEKTIPMDEWLTFFGFWLAEGWPTRVKKNGGFNYIVEISNYDTQFLNNLKHLLESWGFHAHVRPPRLRIYSKQLYDYLVQFGKSHQKYIPKEIKALSSKHLNVLLENYMRGDGHDNGDYLAASTSSERLRDDLQEIALKMGISANYSLDSAVGRRSRMKIEDRSVVAKHDNWRLGFIRKENTPRVYAARATKEGQERFVEEWVDYDGMVGCVEVPNHIIYVRRDGIPVWCGNTGFAKRPFEADSTFFVQGICYLGANMIDSRFFRDVPPDDFRHMQENHDDYLYVLEKYGSKKLVNRAIRASVVVI